MCIYIYVYMDTWIYLYLHVYICIKIHTCISLRLNRGKIWWCSKELAFDVYATDYGLCLISIELWGMYGGLQKNL